MAQLMSVWFCLLSVVMYYSVSVCESTTFTFVNKCEYTVWPGILTNAGVAPLPTTGFVLAPGQSQAVSAPASWGGRFWGRSKCSVDESTGSFSCVTGDCASGKVECSGNGAVPPATLAEFTLDGSGGMDFFDVSLVDGYNLPMMVTPVGGSGNNCNKTGCVVDLNESCPAELRVTSADGDGVACKSACEAFGQPEFCCSGEYGTPDKCRPSQYSEAFKLACPSAYSYAYDDKTSTFTCTDADYTITFCPSPSTSQKSTNSSTRSPVDGTMVYEGGLVEQTQSSSSRAGGGHHVLRLGIIIIVTVAVWLLLLW